MKNLFLALVGLLPVAAWSQHDHDLHIDEVIVSGSQNKSLAETAMPVTVMSGETLRKQAAATLGETIAQQPGVHSSSFGNGVGQPIIRGLSGNRVLVLQESLGMQDASSLSPDHASATEALLADRIEIIRGPATLLYGNGAIGGIVNVIDNRIPETQPEQLTGGVEVRGNSADDGKTAVGRVEGGTGQLAWHLSGLWRETNNVEIPDWAIDEEAIEAAHEEEEHHDEEEDAFDNSRGFVGNSNTEAQQLNGGLSWVGDWGFAGLAVSEMENQYGLPPGAHEHEEEAHGEEEHGEEVVRLKLEQTKVDFKAGINLNGPLLDQLRFALSDTDYEHVELEGDETGTIYRSDGHEARFTANHTLTGAVSGVWGLQLGQRSFSASGEEAFIPKADIDHWGLFAVETFDAGSLTYELGLRVDRQTIDINALCDSEETNWSASGSVLWQVAAEQNLTLGISRAQRAPSVEELYSNIATPGCARNTEPVEHLATARIEYGNPDLKNETSQNLELGWQKYAGDVRYSANIFYNHFDDFIYLADTGEEDEVIVSEFLQEDANLYGIEGNITLPLWAADNQHLDLSLFGDYVAAELRSGDYLPRIAPGRLGFELEHLFQAFAFKLRTTWVDKQTKVSGEDTATDGYTRVDAGMDYHLDVGNGELLVFLNGRNLTDETIRDHTSFMKNFAPAAGRSWELGLRYQF